MNAVSSSLAEVGSSTSSRARPCIGTQRPIACRRRRCALTASNQLSDGALELFKASSVAVVLWICKCVLFGFSWFPLHMAAKTGFPDPLDN